MMILVLVAVVSIMVNVILAKELKKVKKERVSEKRMNKVMTEALVKAACSANRELGQAKEHIKRLEDQLDIASRVVYSFKDKAEAINKRYEKLEDSHLKLSGTLIDFIRSGKLIKTEYMGKVIKYDFQSLTPQEVEEFGIAL